MNAILKLKKVFSNVLVGLFDWDWTDNNCNLLFGTVEMSEELRRKLNEKED